MSKYLKKFDTAAQYTAAESSLILPNVSIVTENNTVHYNPYVDPSGGHPYVEIGGIKWATMNVGATAVTDTGLYFQWGDTQGYTAAQVGSGEGKKYFDWADYKYGNGTSSPGATGMTKYNASDGKTVLDAEDDAVTAAWGGSWRMPTTQEIQSLSAATTTAWTSNYEHSFVAGLVFTSTADSSKKLFFPTSGSARTGNVGDACCSGGYWSSSLFTSDVMKAYLLYFSGSSVNWQHGNSRYFGRVVRGVLDA